MKRALLFIILFFIILINPKITKGQIYDLVCPTPKQPFSPLVTNNPQTGNLKANACIDATGLLTWNGLIGVGSAAGSPGDVQVNVGGVLSNNAGGVSAFKGDFEPFGPNPYIDIRSTGASGSTQNTTATCVNGSPNVTLASAIDFKNGQGIVLYKCGPVATVTIPTGTTVTNIGTAGATTSTYTVTAYDYNLGTLGASGTFSTTTGNASPTYQNYNLISWTCSTWTPPANTPGLIIYSITRNGSYLGMTDQCSYNDTGQTASATRPFWVPSGVPASANDDLETTISSGAGSTALILNANASNGISGVYTQHDDTPAYKAAENQIITTGGKIQFPSYGTFPIGNLYLGNPGVGGAGHCQITQNKGFITLQIDGALAPFKPIVINCPNIAIRGDRTGQGGSFITQPGSLLVDNGMAPVILVTHFVSGIFTGAVFSNVIDGIAFNRTQGDNVLEYCNGPSDMTLRNSYFGTGAGRGVFVGCTTQTGGTIGGFGFFAYNSTFSAGTGGFGLDLNFGQAYIRDSFFVGCPVNSTTGLGTVDFTNILSETNNCNAFLEDNTSTVGNGQVVISYKHVELADAVGGGDKYLVETNGNNTAPLQDVTVFESRGWTQAVVGGNQNVNNCVGFSTSAITGTTQTANCTQAASYASSLQITKGSGNYIGPKLAPFGNTTMSFSPPANSGGAFGVFALASQQCCTSVGSLSYWVDQSSTIQTFISGDGAIHTALPLIATSSVNAATYVTATNCSVNSTSPAACGSAASGAVVVPTTTTTYTINTTAVTNGSRIFIEPITDNTSLSGSPTCNAPPTPFVGYISGRTAGTSFTFTLPSTTGTSCWYYNIIN